MNDRVLCVAEKASIAKAVARHLSNCPGASDVQTRDISGFKYAKNYEFRYDFGRQLWGKCGITFTSVAGHLTELEFDGEYRKWTSCKPGDLFDGRLITYVKDEYRAVARNIESLARYSRVLFIWTDCDREGEQIGREIRDCARKSHPSIIVKRAIFNNIERNHVIHAAQNPGELDERAGEAVVARMELDLRIGASFTRLLTLNLQPVSEKLHNRVISYGSCQFPTLGLVVDRYWKVQRFQREEFWRIDIELLIRGVRVKFGWKRGKLFDRLAAILIYESCMGKTAKVDKLEKKVRRKWKPLPLTTVDLQKCGTKFLGMDSQRVMKVAEDLYTKSLISYPRTETDQFETGMDLKGLIRRQENSRIWGEYSRSLLNEPSKYDSPRKGKRNDKAHPPIHPVNFIELSKLSMEEKTIYEFVVRRFLACCSHDAIGEQRKIEITCGGFDATDSGRERFIATGLRVVERNYLDIYKYDKWESSSEELPEMTVGEEFTPDVLELRSGFTVGPSYLTEPELIGLMDSHGIGTDATMAEHILKIREREYVVARKKTKKGGDKSTGVGSGILEFIPSRLGCALIEGYEELNLEKKMSKPNLRREMELELGYVCQGLKSRSDLVREQINLYRNIFYQTEQRMAILKATISKHM